MSERYIDHLISQIETAWSQIIMNVLGKDQGFVGTTHVNDVLEEIYAQKASGEDISEEEYEKKIEQFFQVLSEDKVITQKPDVIQGCVAQLYFDFSVLKKEKLAENEVIKEQKLAAYFKEMNALNSESAARLKDLFSSPSSYSYTSEEGIIMEVYSSPATASVAQEQLSSAASHASALSKYDQSPPLSPRKET